MQFILNTITPWDEPPRARHQIAESLSRIYPVVFVSANKTGLPKLNVIQIHKNLDVITPYFPIPSKIRYRLPFINKIYQKWLFQRLIQKYDGYSVINFDFAAKFISDYFKTIIYYCNDDHIALSQKSNPKWIAKYHKDAEKIMAAKSSFCVSTSEYLCNRLKKYNENSFYIKLGSPVIEANHYKTSKNQSEIIRVSYLGFINTVSFDLIQHLVSNDCMQFTFIGPINNKLRRTLSAYANVKITGTLTGATLYNELRKSDVGIIPYNIKSKIDRTPNKLWQYLSLGIPVVVSNIPGIRDWIFPDGFVYRANTYEDFTENIIQAFKEDTNSLIKERISFAKENSWDKRVEEFLERYKKIIANK